MALNVNQIQFGENKYLGTYNQGILYSKVDDLQLRNLASIEIFDDSPFSDNYFNVVEFPNVFTAGKNLIKLRANANTLVDMSRVYVEIIDYNGNPVYTEPISYREADGTRVISIWVYIETPPGPCRVYIGGRARINPITNEEYTASPDYDAPDYMHIPNILWSRLTNISPLQLNNTEIIFVRPPAVKVGETIIPYYAPIDLVNIINYVSGTAMTGSGDEPGFGGGEGVSYGLNSGTERRVRDIRILPASSKAGYTPTGISDSMVLGYGTNVDAITGEYNPAGIDGMMIPNLGEQTIYADDFTAWMESAYGTLETKIIPINWLEMQQQDFINQDAGSTSVGQQNQVSYVVTSYSLLDAQGTPQPPHDYSGAMPLGDGWFTDHMEGGIVRIDNLMLREYSGPPLMASRIPMSPNGKPPIGVPGVGGNRRAHCPTFRQVIEYYNQGGNGSHFLAQGQPGLNTVNQGTGTGPVDSFICPGNGDPVLMSGSAFMAISEVINSSTALGFHVGGYRLQSDTNEFGGGQFRFPAAGVFIPGVGFGNDALSGGVPNVSYKSIPQKSLKTLVILETTATSSFTCSFVPPYTTIPSQQSQSFAEIQFGDLTPATGDVHHVNIYYKPGGQIGEYIDAGRLTLEQIDIATDTSSVDAPSLYSGVQPARMGFFADQTRFDRYFVTGAGDPGSVDPEGITNVLNGVPDPEVALASHFYPSQLSSAMRFTGSADQTFNSTNERFAYFAFRPNSVGKLNLGRNSDYMVTLNCTAFDIMPNSDPNVPLPRLDIYASGSRNRVYPNNLTINNYLTSQGTADNDGIISNLDPTLAMYDGSPLVDGGVFGHRIGTLELQDSGSHRNAKFAFRTDIDQNVQVFFVIRSGEWHVSNIALRTATETGFTPNYARVFMKILEHLIHHIFILYILLEIIQLLQETLIY